MPSEVIYEDQNAPELRDILAAVDAAERALRDVRAAVQRGERGAALEAARAVAGHAGMAGTLAVRAGMAKAAVARNYLHIARYAAAASADAEKAVQARPISRRA